MTAEVFVGREVTPALRAEQLTVRFGDFTAVDRVSAQFEPGQVHAIVGQNGAGKTTFARALAGIVAPTGGYVELAGRRLIGGDVQAARRAGLDMVHQSFALPPSATVAEAIEMFVPTRRVFAPFRGRQLESKWAGRLAALGADIDVSARISTLPVEALQSIEIARTLAGNARVLILDEPTAVLAPTAVDDLFRRLRRLADDGMTVLIILHKVREVLGVADTVTVLRAGRCVLATHAASGLAAAELAELMVGEAAAGADVRATAAPADTGPYLDHVPATRPGRGVGVELLGASTAQVPGDAALAEVEIKVGKGEVVGVAGVEGNGQRSLVNAVLGLQPLTAGLVVLDGADATTMSVAERRRRGLRYIPFERNTEGVSLTSSLWQNMAPALFEGRALVSPRRLRALAKKSLDEWDVRYRDVEQPAGELSGGNIQKLIFARELMTTPTCLVAAHPTRGLDLAASAIVHRALSRLREQGAGVLLVSPDLDELTQLADRIVVLYGGRIVATFTRPFDLARVGRCMVGGES